MLTEILSGVLGAATSAVATYYAGTWATKDRDVLLKGQALAELADYPIKVQNDGALSLDLPAMKRVSTILLDTYNPRAAVDLLYLAEHNRDVVSGSDSTVQLLDRVRRRYKKKFPQLVEPRALLNQREHLLKQFYNITNGLGDTFSGVPIEFVLHDTRDLLHSICVIKNPITGRKEGDPASSFGENVIQAYAQMRWTGTKHSYRLKDPKTLREFKATTIPLEDKTLGLIAFLCVNIDIARFSPDSKDLSAIAERLVSTPGGWGAQVFKVEV